MSEKFGDFYIINIGVKGSFVKMSMPNIGQTILYFVGLCLTKKINQKISWCRISQFSSVYSCLIKSFFFLNLDLGYLHKIFSLLQVSVSSVKTEIVMIFIIYVLVGIKSLSRCNPVNHILKELELHFLYLSFSPMFSISIKCGN